MTWMNSTNFATCHDFESGQGVPPAARAYETGDTAKLPVLRRRVPQDQYKRKYEYRLDSEATWTAQKVAAMARRLGWCVTTMAREIGMNPGTLRASVAKPETRWMGKKYHEALDALAEDREAELSSWWAVCDHTCKRYVVGEVCWTLEDAEASAARQKPWCPTAIVRGTGTPPKVDDGLKHSREGIDYELVRTEHQRRAS